MEIDEYQDLAHETASYNEKKTFPVMKKELLLEIPLYPFLKVITESAEMGEHIIKVAFREDKPYIDIDTLIKEMGDILWYVAEMATQLDLPLSFIAETNITKLRDRKERGVIKGSGDNR